MSDSQAEAVEAALREASLQCADAIVSNDAERIDACLASEWRLVDADGVTERSRFLEVVRSGALTHSMMRPVGDVDVRVYENMGVVLARVVNTAHFGGRIFEADEWTTDLFVRRDGRWVCAHSHVTPVNPGPAAAD